MNGWAMVGLLASLGCLPFGALGCARTGPGRPPAPNVAARIGEEDLPYQEFQSYLSHMVGDSEEVLGSDVLSQLLDQLLEEKLLVRLAVDRGLAPAGSTSRAAIDALLRGEQAREPEEAEVAEYYRAHRQDFARPERVRLRQMLTEQRAQAEEARRELQGGADFEGVARRLSSGPPGGGLQGELAREDLPPAFVDVIFALRPGEVSPVVPAGYGYHLFQVVARLPAEVVPLAQARGEIASRLLRTRSDRLLKSLLQQAQARYTIVVYGRNLPFSYQGSYAKSQAPRG